jgi:hypothetical protein
VDERLSVHSVHFGRSSSLGWIQVDQFANVTGKAPGIKDTANITAKVFLNVLTETEKR